MKTVIFYRLSDKEVILKKAGRRSHDNGKEFDFGLCKRIVTCNGVISLVHRSR